MEGKEVAIWRGPAGIIIPETCSKPQELITYATGLKERQQKDIILAFENQAYDMGAEYTWRRSMIRLKSTLKSLGMNFIGEMLDDDDIDEFSNIELVLNDYNAIMLAEQLGSINSTGALKLRQSLEILNHYLSDEAEKNNEYLSAVEAAILVQSCVKYILGEQEISISIEFSEFRKRLFSETMALTDPQVEQLLGSPIFYIKTVVSVLLTGIKNEKGAALEHAVGNLNTLIEPIWKIIPEKEKWQIGNAYRDTTAAGNLVATKGLKNALLKVKGFDYVPENLRSSTFKKAAKSLIDAHFGMDNFYTEIPLVNNLAKLGSSIPAPAFIECIQAYLCVYLGNSYGISHSAAPVAKTELIKIPKDRWIYYFAKVLSSDEIILSKLLVTRTANRFVELLQMIDINEENLEDITIKKLVKGLKDGKVDIVYSIATKLYSKLRS